MRCNIPCNGSVERLRLLFNGISLLMFCKNSFQLLFQQPDFRFRRFFFLRVLLRLDLHLLSVSSGLAASYVTASDVTNHKETR